MTFNIIGNGNIAWFFASTLLKAKHHCTGIYARDVDAAKQLADHLLVQKWGKPSDIEDGEAAICFVAISDSAIVDVVKALSFKQTVIVHTAGAVSIDILNSSAKSYGVFWPIYSILKTNPPAHRNIPCAWEASDAKAQKYILEICHAITDELIEAKFEQRKWIHLSAVIGNNFINHLLSICDQICTNNHIPFSTVLPIINQTFDRIKHTAPKALQTGPAIRNDTSTIKAQIELLEGHKDWQKIYEVLTNSIKNSK